MTGEQRSLVTQFNQALKKYSKDEVLTILPLLQDVRSLYIDTETSEWSCPLPLLHYTVVIGWDFLAQHLLIHYKCNPNIRDSNGLSAVHLAVKAGNKPLVKLILDNGGCTDTPSSSSLTPLHLACQNGNLEVSTLLLEEYNCSPSSLCSGSRTPLHYAAMSGSIALVSNLVSVHSSDPTSLDAEGKTPLELAWMCQKLEVVQLFTNGIVSVIPDANDSSGDTSSCLSWVCAQDNFDAVKLLVETKLSNVYDKNKHGKSVVHSMFERQQWKILEFILSNIPASKISVFTDEMGITPLHLACKSGCLALTKLLIEKHHCDPLCEDSQQNTPLHYACTSQCQETVQYLLTLPNVSLMQENVLGRSVLHLLCIAHKSELILSLLQENVLDPVACNSGGHNLAHLAAKEGLPKVLGELSARSGAKVLQAQDGFGYTPLDIAWCNHQTESIHALLQLHDSQSPMFVVPFGGVLFWACSMGMFDTVESIVSRNLSNVHLKNPSGDTVLHHAYFQKQWRIFDFLCTQVNDPAQFVNADGLSPMHLACMLGRTQLVKRFAEKLNYSPTLPDNKGKTPLHYACSGYDHHLVLYLVSITSFNLTLRDKSKTTPLENLFLFRASETLLTLLEDGACDLSFVTSQGQNMLHLACKYHMPRIMEFISRKCPCAVELMDASGSTPFDLLWLTGNIEAVSHFLPTNFDVKNVNISRFHSVLHWACQAGRLEVVKYVTNRKLSNTKKLGMGKSILYIAAYNHHWEIVKYLIDSSEEWREDGCVLNLACTDGQLEIIDYLIKEKYWSIMAKDDKQCTILENACLAHNYSIIEYFLKETKHKVSEYSYLYENAIKLVECPLTLLLSLNQDEIVCSLVQRKYIDPTVQTKLGRSLLHLACVYDCLLVVKYLLQQKACEVNDCDSSGNTPLHLACLNSHYDVAVYLISIGCATSTVNKNGKEPLQLASDTCRAQLRSFISLVVKHRIASPVSEFIKVFLLGCPKAGKSTLARNLELKSAAGSSRIASKVRDRFRTVTGVSLNTTGIIPINIQNNELGCMTLYDFAGQPEYYSSHAALLQSLMQSPDTLFVIFLNLRDSLEKIRKNLLYWVMFTSNLSSHPQFILVCSHADEISEEEKTQKCAEINSVSNDYLGSNCHGLIAFDLRKMSSTGLNSFLSLLKQVCRSLVADSSKEAISSFCHMLMTYFRKETKYTAIQLGDLASTLLIQSESGSSHLPSDIEALSDHLSVLSSKGLILYLKKSDRLEKGWVVLDSKSLLSDVTGTIFAPVDFTSYKPLATNTGIVPLAMLLEVFPKYDPDLLIRFLEYFEFCHKIDPLLLEDIITNLQPSNTKGSLLCAEDELYFFPGLIKEEKPSDLLEVDYSFGWCLECEIEHQFFDSRCLHVLFSRLAYRFSPVSKSERGLPTYGHKRKCKVWKNGIFWLDENGIAVQVEALEHNRVLLLLMSYKEGSKTDYILLRSKLISTILSVQQELCSKLDLNESLLSPGQLCQNPPPSFAAVSKFDINDLAVSVVNHRYYVSERFEGSSLLDVREALVYEPYMLLQKPALAQVCSSELQANAVPAALYQEVLKSCSQDGFRLTQWKKSEFTHALLRDHLDHFSIFAGRSVLVRIVECMYW